MTAAYFIAISTPPRSIQSLSPTTLVFTAILFVVVVGGAIALGLAARKFLRAQSHSPEGDWAAPTASAENPSAFMAASMQGVIEKLRTQERELARLHHLEQERARESERITEEVTRNMPTGLLLLSAKGAITSANPAAEAALGVTGMQYRAYAEVLGEDSPISRMLADCLRDGRTVHRAEIEHATPRGEVRHLGVTISPIERIVSNYSKAASDSPLALAVKETKITGALCLMSDLTELTDLQRQIRWKENLAALGEMSAGIAHEFKNSLATISGYAQMIHQEAPAGDIRENSERLLDQTRALTHVVTEFLRFARPLELSYETLQAESLVQRVAGEIQEAVPGCSIGIDGNFAEVPGDEGLLRQALLNLVRNAAEAVRDRAADGRVTISGTVEERGGRTWQRISVQDNGRGIPAADIEKVFLPFFTTKSEGTGLGLAVVQKVAMQHGGTIEARNHTGGGAEFILSLPLRQEPVPPAIVPASARV